MLLPRTRPPLARPARTTPGWVLPAALAAVLALAVAGALVLASTDGGRDAEEAREDFAGIVAQFRPVGA